MAATPAYIEELQEQYKRDPVSVDAEWRAFFEQMNKDSAPDGKLRPSWSNPSWPIPANGELVRPWMVIGPSIERKLSEKVSTEGSRQAAASVSTEDIQLATRDSVRALMMIRAYRMRGHFHANLDPLGLEQKGDYEELHPSSYGFRGIRLQP